MVALAACAAPDPGDLGFPTPSTLFVSDYDANAIVRYDGVTGEPLGVFATGAPQRVDRPAGVRLGPDGRLYTAGFGQGDIVRYDVRSGAMMGVFFWDTTLLEEPVELAFHGDDLVVLGNDTSNIVVLDRGGTPIAAFGNPVMRAAHDFVIGRDDLLYIATDSHPQLGIAIQVWDFTGTMRRQFATPGEIAVASSLAFDRDGVLHVCDYDRGTVVRFDAATGESRGVLIDGLIRPVSLDFGLDGDLYVLDDTGVHRFDPRSGDPLGELARVGDGQLERPRSFTFVSEHAIRAAP